MTSPKLARCFKCNASVSLMTRLTAVCAHSDKLVERYKVHCIICGLQTGEFARKLDALINWNSTRYKRILQSFVEDEIR